MIVIARATVRLGDLASATLQEVLPNLAFSFMKMQSSIKEIPHATFIICETPLAFRLLLRRSYFNEWRAGRAKIII